MLKNFLGVVKLLIVIDIHVLIDIQISFLKINHSCLIQCIKNGVMASFKK